MPIPADAEWDLGTDDLGENTHRALKAAGITPAMADGMTREERKKIPGMDAARLARLAATLRHMRAEAERRLMKYPMTPGGNNPLAVVERLAEDNPIPPVLRKQIENWIEFATEDSGTDHADAMSAIEIAYPLIRDYLAGVAAAAAVTP